jgi:nicotinate-nucleotide adenylyltransferase
MLTPDPPHKRGEKVTLLGHRLKMVELAIEDDDRFKLSYVDINRPGPHYAVDSIKILKEHYSDRELIYLMGGDSLQDLPKWYKSSEFLAQVDGVGVMRRPGDDIDLRELIEALPELSEKLNFVTAPLLEISAEQIRIRAGASRAFRYYVLPKIYRYILEYRLYQG